MAPKKLTEADKQTILGLYHQPGQTTSTLAERYGVSNSTISRLLKASLPEAVYSALIQQKRTPAEKDSAVLPDQILEPSSLSDSDPPLRTVAAPVLKKQKLQLTSEGNSGADAATPTPDRMATASMLPDLGTGLSTASSSANSTDFGMVEAKVDLEAAWAEDEEALDDDYLDDEDFEEEDGEEETWERGEAALQPQLEALEIYPLTAEALPSLCYLVVERMSSELVALPLRTFANLGQIPEVEGDSRTLPVFDNHHIARRFSRRNQRVIKVPDGMLLQTTMPYLKAKGITRLLIDGQVFTLDDAQASIAEV
ncbi:MAG: helix-turn-helix domain-containing protein [Cyanobacteria bacterium REEB459]|nr:helix-turn-helix domain-containing protein [Cyanobacteria bacterium REEB459]